MRRPLAAVPPGTPDGSPFGLVMLAHTAFGRAAQAIRHWAGGGCPVVVHVDRAVPQDAFDAFRQGLSDLPDVAFSPRHRCEWGSWGIVAATQEACELLLARRPDLGHVYLASGSCLPLRPVSALRAYLAARADVDFIESATTADVPWTVGGLSEERFTLRFPFSWRRQRRLFDAWVDLQRRLRLSRPLPPGIEPHMGSQWWCLTRGTLTAILRDPRRDELDRFFRRVWIPDESYFQTLARRHSRRVESRSLTLSKFDFQGKPHIFYDDHLQLLRRSDCFVARKAWPHADGLYRAFLGGGGGAEGAEPQPGKIDRVFAKATERRTRGRPGLYMQSRWPHQGWENGITAAPYSVFEGFAELYEDWEDWLRKATGARVHGHLFAPGGAEFEGRGATFMGALPAGAALRDHDPRAFLRSLIWNTRGERQCFQHGPMDSQGAAWEVARDPNAQVSVISGAWAVPLFRAAGGAAGGGRDISAIRRRAARLQKVESEHISMLRSPHAKARVRVWTLAEYLEAPEEALGAILDEIAAGGGARAAARRPETGPRRADLAGFGRFLQALKNQGMHPYLMGDFPVEPEEAPASRPGEARPRRPYLVK